jgi:Flp pilus assembly CpaE family ATPase
MVMKMDGQDSHGVGGDDEADSEGADNVGTGRSLVLARGKGSRALTRRSERRFTVDREIIKLFYAVDALKEEDKSFVLQFLSATPKEGTTTIAWSYAFTASYEYAMPTLLVDCSGPGRNPDTRPSLIDAFFESGRLDDAIISVPDSSRLKYARLSANPHSMLEMDAAEIRELFEFLKLDYTAIILDCPAANHANESLALSRHADGTIIVVRSGHARRGVVEWTQESIEQFGGACLGAVFNCREKRIPAWLYRLI